MDRRKRLARLVILQQRLKELHEVRRAAHLRDVAAASAEVDMLLERLEAPDSLSALFPALYHERIARAIARREESLRKADAESAGIAAADARAAVADRARREAVRSHERSTEEKAILDMLESRRKTDGMA